jgi:hypothetical protein
MKCRGVLEHLSDFRQISSLELLNWIVITRYQISYAEVSLMLLAQIRNSKDNSRVESSSLTEVLLDHFIITEVKMDLLYNMLGLIA